MTGLGDLFKQIGNIDSTVKLIAFLASIFVLTVIAILKYSSKISKQAANILFVFFGAVFIIACIAMILSMSGKRTDTLTLTLTDSAGIPYNADQADFSVNSKTASVDYSPLAKSWTIVFDPVKLPNNRAVYLSAYTKDRHFKADTLIRLTDDLFQTLVLPLQQGISDTHGPPPPPDTTFSMNLSDEKIRQAIARLTGLTYDPGSNRNRIVVTYEPSKIRANHGSGTYSFESSSPVVLVDGKRFVLDGCTIPEMVPNNSHDEEVIKKYAQTESIEVATIFFRRNPEILARWIKPR